METINDWVDYKFDFSQYIKDENWNDLSLRYVSDELTEKYIDKLDWSIIAVNWDIDQSFYNKFKTKLEPYRYILKLRQRCGFISNNLETE